MKIKTISFLVNDYREKVYPDDEGLFRFPDFVSKKNLTATESVTHPKLKTLDPFLTLDGDRKLRVYHGGDHSQFVVEAISAIEIFDSEMSKHRKKEEPAEDAYYTGAFDGIDFGF